TGGTRGLGAGIVDAFLAAGATVVTCARHEPTEPPRASVFLRVDVRDPGEVDAMLGEILQRFGRLDVVINNAGGSPLADAATASPRFAQAIVDLNLVAPLMIAERANEHMQAQRTGGVIINISSMSGTRPSPGTAAYGAAKAGLIAA